MGLPASGRHYRGMTSPQSLPPQLPPSPPPPLSPLLQSELL